MSSPCDCYFTQLINKKSIIFDFGIKWKMNQDIRSGIYTLIWFLIGFEMKIKIKND